VEYEQLFETDNAEVLALAKRVMEKCVLAMLREPKPPLTRTWVAPGGPHYLGQWIWDTMFVLDHLCLLPGREAQIRDIFQNYWDFQDRWNATMPDHARDMITVAIKTEPQEQRQFSQIPILAWGVERIHQRNGDKKLLEQCLGRLERFHEWYWRERDLHGNGLITVGAYTANVQHARWETFDYECNMDDLKLTKHPTRKEPEEGSWYGDLCVPGNNAYLIRGERSLARLADIMGDNAMAARRRERIAKGVEGMRRHMWDEEAGAFLTVNRDTLEKIPVITIGSWIPLAAGVPTEAQAKRMAEVLGSPVWQTPLPVPTVDPGDSRWKSGAFWRGDVWPATNYQIASGLAAYGHRDLAADIADKTVANAIKNGLSEHYDSMTGKALGVADYSMASTVLAMMLDGLTEKHQVRLRKTTLLGKRYAEAMPLDCRENSGQKGAARQGKSHSSPGQESGTIP
jgi:putative isomerase